MIDLTRPLTRAELDWCSLAFDRQMFGLTTLDNAVSEMGAELRLWFPLNENQKQSLAQIILEQSSPEWDNTKPQYYHQKWMEKLRKSRIGKETKWFSETYVPLSYSQLMQLCEVGLLETRKIVVQEFALKD